MKAFVAGVLAAALIILVLVVASKKDAHALWSIVVYDKVGKPLAWMCHDVRTDGALPEGRLDPTDDIHIVYTSTPGLCHESIR